MPETPINREIEEKAHWIEHPMKRFFSLKEASVYTAMSEPTIRKAYYDGLLPAIKRGAKSKLVFDVLDLNNWMLEDKQSHSATETRPRARNGRFKK